MISLTCTVLAMIYCGMVCECLDAAASPCGWRLCRDMCDSLSSCSSPDYRVETLTCVLRNGSLGVGQGGVRECRNLTSRRGDNVTVCSSAVDDVERGTGVNASTVKIGTPLLLSNTLYGYYSGRDKVIFIDRHVLKQEKLTKDLTIKSVMLYKGGKTSLRMTNGCLFRSRFIKGIETFDDRDLITHCLTGLKYMKAYQLGFRILT